VQVKKSRLAQFLTKRYLLEQFHRGTDVIHDEENEDTIAALEALHNRGQLTPEGGLETKVPGVLRGEWDLSNVHIQELAARFRLIPGLFLRKVSPTTS
jgi:hypothetical protein